MPLTNSSPKPFDDGATGQLSEWVEKNVVKNIVIGLFVRSGLAQGRNVFHRTIRRDDQASHESWLADRLVGCARTDSAIQLRTD